MPTGLGGPDAVENSGFGAVIPGADGSLYAYRHAPGPPSASPSSATAVLERLPLSVEQLVSATPRVTSDGSLLVGSRAARVFALDPLSGELLGEHSGGGFGTWGGGGGERGDVSPWEEDSDEEAAREMMAFAAAYVAKRDAEEGLVRGYARWGKGGVACLAPCSFRLWP